MTAARHRPVVVHTRPDGGMVTAARILLLLLVRIGPLATLGALAAPVDAQPRLLRGSVRDVAGTAVPSAIVRVVGGRTAVTDSSGRFRVAELPDGEHTLEVRAIGYAPRTFHVVLGPDRDDELLVPLERLAVQLDSVHVVAPQVPLRPGLREFEERLQVPIAHGRRWTAADIARRRPAFVSDLFTNLPSVRVVGYGAQAGLVFQRGIVTLPSSTPASRSATRPGSVRAAGVSTAGCLRVYLDGMRGVRVNDVDPSLLHGIEFYLAAEAPVQYTGFDTCAVLLLWTK